MLKKIVTYFLIFSPILNILTTYSQLQIIVLDGSQSTIFRYFIKHSTYKKHIFSYLYIYKSTRYYMLRKYF